MAAKETTPHSVTNESDPNPDTSAATRNEYGMSEMMTESQRKLIAFEIAEAAKKQVTAWAKWIVGGAVAVGATLGLTTYLDVQSSIKNATDKQIERAQERSDNAIVRFEEEQKKELAAFRRQSEEAFAVLEQDIQNVLGTVQRRGREAEIAILAVVDRTTTVAESPRTIDRRGRQRPIGPGISVSGKYVGAGTICCIVKDQMDQRFILTTSYVAGADAHAGDVVVQPGMGDGGTDRDAIGAVDRVTEVAALIRLHEGIDAYYDIPDIGTIRGVGEPQLGQSVRKYGRTTGLTSGTVTETDAIANVSFSDGRPRAVRCFVVTGVARQFAEAGDGGAPVVNADGELIGMHFAGAPATSRSFDASFVVRIRPILEELGVEIVSAK